MSFADDSEPEPPAPPDLLERALDLAYLMTPEQRAELARRLDSNQAPGRTALPGRMVGADRCDREA